VLQNQSELKTITISVRVDPLTYECISSIADRLFNGKKSSAIREALAIGLCTLCDRECPARRLTLTHTSKKLEIDLGTAELHIELTLLPKKIEKPVIFEQE